MEEVKMTKKKIKPKRRDDLTNPELWSKKKISKGSMITDMPEFLPDEDEEEEEEEEENEY